MLPTTRAIFSPYQYYVLRHISIYDKLLVTLRYLLCLSLLKIYILPFVNCICMQINNENVLYTFLHISILKSSLALISQDIHGDGVC